MLVKKFLSFILRKSYLVNRLAEYDLFYNNLGVSYYNMLFSAADTYSVGVRSNSREQKLTICLTTIPSRISTIHLVIESLFQQETKADRIILYLDSDNFSKKNIPNSLLRQEKRGLQIRFCNNIFSYKKLIFGLIEFPDDLIITADDDLLYPYSWIGGLYKAYLADPTVIHGYRGSEILKNKGKLNFYRNWKPIQNSSEASLNVFLTGGAGALYFPGCFHRDIIRQDLFLELCPTADDVWFKMMSFKAGIKSRVIAGAQLYSESSLEHPFFDFNNTIHFVPETQAISLTNINNSLNGKSQNDVQIERLLDFYDLHDKFAR